MDNNYETFLQLYKSAPSDIQAFIDSEVIGQFARVIIDKYQLSSDQKNRLISVIADLVLDPSLDTKKSLSEINIAPVKINEVVVEVNQFIEQNTSTDTEATKAEPIPTSQIESETTENGKDETDPNNLTKEIAEVEADIKSIPTIHTMQDDIKSTSQEDILKNRRPDQN